MTVDDLDDALARLPVAWQSALAPWTTADRDRLVQRIREVSMHRAIAPADPLRALRLLAPGDVRVVVIGQDPYPTPGQADGLAFSAERSSRPSLRRIFDVLEADRPGWRRPASGRLDAWARQGVLLLNTVLSVELGRPASHIGVGWQALTSMITSALCERRDPPVFLLWGRHAQAFFESARPERGGVPVMSTRHPSNDTRREFMSEGSHFAATSGRVDWWGLA